MTAISQAQIQRYFGGFAWVLVPQSPTFWMDNGTEQLGHSNQSIYSPVIKRSSTSLSPSMPTASTPTASWSLAFPTAAL